jgi:phospholipid/cholesterol/gamma-HCH transport system substrate-binding protein
MPATPGHHPHRHSVRGRELRAAALAAALIIAGTAFVFTKRNPFAETHRIEGVFVSAAQLRPGSEVRIGGRKIGVVNEISRGPGHSSLVGMDLDSGAPAIRRDAHLTLRPRLALEGNAYIDVQPGTPRAPVLATGGRVPLNQTAVSVQLDQVIDIFDAPTRGGFQDAVKEFGDALGTRPPSSRTPQAGYVELRSATGELSRSLRTFATAARAVDGQRPGDLRSAVQGTGAMTEQLGRDPQALAGIVSSYARLSGALASRDRQLSASLRGFAVTLGEAPTRLRVIDGALPAVTRFADALRPALQSAPPALRALTTTAMQVRRLAARGELPRLLTRLAPLTAELPVLQRRLSAALPQARDIGACLVRTVVPALNKQIDDGALSTHRPVWQDALHMASNTSGAASAFEANGGTLRLGVTESEQAVKNDLGSHLGTAAGFLPTGETGINPTWLGYGVEPPWRPDARCADQQLPDYSARRKPGRPDLLKNFSPASGRPSAGLLRKLLGQLDQRSLLRQVVR